MCVYIYIYIERDMYRIVSQGGGCPVWPQTPGPPVSPGVNHNDDNDNSRNDDDSSSNDNISICVSSSNDNITVLYYNYTILNKHPPRLPETKHITNKQHIIQQ